MATLDLIELVKHAKEAGLPPADINALVAREEERVEFPGLKLPSFNDGKDEIDDYLKRFERVAELQNWGVQNYYIYLGSFLTGKALKTYVSLPDEILHNYDLLKDALLKTYSVDAESYRKKFRESRIGENETYIQLVSRMEQYLSNWLALSNVKEDYHELCEFLVQDQLLSNCPTDLRVFLKERIFNKVTEMAQAADRFRSAHRRLKTKYVNYSKSETSEKLSISAGVVCHSCNKAGHIRPNCPDLKSRTGMKCPPNKVNFVLESDLTPKNSVTGKALLFNKPVDAHFDSGCSTIIIRDNLVPPHVKKGKLVTLYDYLGVGRNFPRIRCYIKSDFLTGWVNAVAAPIKFTDILIGMVPGVKAPSVDIPNEVKSDCDNTNIIMGVQTRNSKMRAEASVPLVVPDLSLKDISKTDIIDAQSKCQTLRDIRNKVANNSTVNVKNRTVKYEEVDGIIYRKCISSKHNHEIGRKQLVVPSSFRQYILSTAHDSVVSGHFSHRKTADKIFRKFFWPGAGSDIKRYCRSCHVCQKSTPKGKIRKAPLVSMPIISEPFSRVAIDLVGPLIPSERGHKYILTVIDCATRFPEAVPLRSIDTVSVAENLVNIFSRVGIPKEMLSDRGTQFKSDLMKEINRLLSIKAIFTSPYHACCNGTVERFHAVLKSMLKKLCIEKPRDWDRYIPSVLFAYREIPNDTLGFSPFELLYGRQVRGPLSILHDLWTNSCLEDDVKTTYQYVLDLRLKLEESAQLASAHADINSKLYKSYFDRSAKRRVFAEGDEVLVLLPSTHNKLTMQCKGPFSVIKRHENGVDYLVKTKGKIKLYHVNMLKKYVRREGEDKSKEVCRMCIVDDSEVAKDTCSIAVLDQAESKFNISNHLDFEEKGQLNELLDKYSDVFSDEPGITSAVIHDIKLTTDIPVHRKPYPVPHHLLKTFENEVEQMLKLGIIEPSDSPYCSPVVLVKKSDNTWRFCVDFRALNDVSLFDSEPMPTLDGALGNFVGDCIFSEIDLCKGYWQIPLSERAKAYTAFATNRGLMQFTRLPFGLKTACATFVRLMRRVLHGLNNIDCYFDNIVVHSNSWSDHLLDLERLFERLRKYGLTAGPILPNFEKIFYVRTDASDTGLGAILLQKSEGILMPVAYASRALTDREKRYAVIERECLSIVWAINKFKYYLYGREFVLQTDQQPLVYLRNMKNGNGRLMRWSLALQSYSFDIEYIKVSMYDICVNLSSPKLSKSGHLCLMSWGVIPDQTPPQIYSRICSIHHVKIVLDVNIELVAPRFTPLISGEIAKWQKPIHRHHAVPGKAEVEEILAAMKERAASTTEPIGHIVNTFYIRVEGQITTCNIRFLYACRFTVSGSNRPNKGDPPLVLTTKIKY
ncbi:uncharacterized protein LOC134765248 [Penaeus indicus]|uniref:uncharacterized protein LOC134765248 n=1 Tax=Penaeus indicus TaxID=29960 RepID=UPI00300CFA04